MAVSTRSEFIDFIVPLKDRMKLYDKTKPPTDQPKNDATDPAKAIPSGFIDAMVVREEVFVKEQKVPLENELDDDDRRSFHWVAYASIPHKQTSPEPGDAKTARQPSKRNGSTSTKIPIGTIRLVPPPHGRHPNGKWRTDVHNVRESYIKLGRLAVIPEFRKAGIARLLIETALALARDKPMELFQPGGGVAEEHRQEQAETNGFDFRGLVLVHAQKAVQKVWARYGFETDESMGVWDEEGIEHVGMWRRLDVSEGRRKSKVWLSHT